MLLLISTKVIQPPYSKGESQSSTVYNDWPYLNAKIVIYSEFTSVVKEKVVSLHSKNYG